MENNHTEQSIVSPIEWVSLANFQTLEGWFYEDGGVYDHESTYSSRRLPPDEPTEACARCGLRFATTAIQSAASHRDRHFLGVALCPALPAFGAPAGGAFKVPPTQQQLAELKRPAFDIFIGRSPIDTRVKVNGQDIGDVLREIHVSQLAGELVKVTLVVARDESRVVVQAAVDDVVVRNASAA